MASRRARDVALLLSLGAVSLWGPAPDARAAPKPPKQKPAAAPAEKLPAGCTRFTYGYDATVSPDGKTLAYVDESLTAGPYRKPAAGEKPALFVRDVKGGEPASLPVSARPLGWVDRAILLGTGIAVDAKTGAKVPKGIASVPGGPLPLAAVAWTRDGKRVAWVPVEKDETLTAVRVLGEDGKERVLASTEGLRTDQTVLLAWNPEGTRLYVNGLARGDEGRLPARRVALVDPAADAQSVLATMPDWVGIPGLIGERPAYRDPRVEDPGVKLTWSRAAEPRYGPNAFSGDGRLVAWIAGTGWIESDVHVADVATGKVHRVTTDGEAKWSPALDPAGRRVAFLLADGIAVSWTGEFKNPRIRVVDLLTGEPNDVALATEGGVPARLAWTADGKALTYDCRALKDSSAGSPGGSFQQVVAAPKPPPAGATIVSLEYDPRNRIVAWLGSYDSDHVHTAVHRAEDAWDPYYVPALKKTLAEWKDRDGPVLPCLVRMLQIRGVAEMVPDLKAAIDAKDEGRRAEILIALLALGARDVLDEMEKLRKDGKDKDVRLEIALEMARARDDRAWPTIDGAAKEKAFDTLATVSEGLGRVRDPRSVELLLPLLADKRMDPRFARARELVPKLRDVGRTISSIAQASLRRLTAQDFGDDAAKWSAWWKDEAKGELPTLPEEAHEPESPHGG